ncbi:MAG TPA: Gfo/Idh/MocA family oxidoreductase [Vicinamibacterales bacterium]|nr:Gfo/Idh/MocA family oxidoreductase [Vicinamibacterales bacterium]
MPGASRGKGKVRYAVVGLGYIAQSAILPAFAHARRNSSLHALVSGDPVKLRALGDQYDVAVRGSYDELEQCLGEVDAVFIATPNSEHADHCVRAANAGVHVLCEKPLAVTEADCDRMMRACADAGVKLMTAYRLHFDPLMLDVLKQIRSGRIGTLRYVSASFSMQAKPDGIRTRPETGGGTLYDLGVYCINAARMVFAAEPVQVFAYAIDGGSARMPGVDQTTAAVLRYDDERVASFVTGFSSADVSSLRIVGSEGDIHMEPAFEYAEPLKYTLTAGETTIKKRGRKRDQFAAELLYFSDCIRQDREPEPSAEEGARDVTIVERLYESARRNESIALRPFAPEPGPERRQAIDRPPVPRQPDLVHADKPHS